MALRSKSYAPAAWTVAFKESEPTWPLNEVELEKFFDADRALHIMRILSLMGSIMTGGTIVEITDPQHLGPRVVETYSWWPTAALK